MALSYTFDSGIKYLCSRYALDPKRLSELHHNLVDFDELKICEIFDLCITTAIKNGLDPFHLTNDLFSTLRRNPPNVTSPGWIRVNSAKTKDGDMDIHIVIHGTPEYVSEKYAEISAKINHGEL